VNENVAVNDADAGQPAHHCAAFQILNAEVEYHNFYRERRTCPGANETSQGSSLAI
jgi:hypothetical protein